MKLINASKLIDYARYASGNVYFKMYVDKNYMASGTILDAYFGTANIPVLGNRFVILDDLIKRYRGGKVAFEVIGDDDFRACVVSDFIIRDKYDNIPRKFMAVAN